MNNYDINGLIGKKTYGQIMEEMRTKERRRRKEKRITQKELASLTGVSYGSIRRYEETGEISFSAFVKILQALGYDSDLDQVLARPAFSSIEDMLK
jgi:transcriptional regulator with XRE-family HTH domain